MNITTGYRNLPIPDNIESSRYPPEEGLGTRLLDISLVPSPSLRASMRHGNETGILVKPPRYPTFFSFLFHGVMITVTSYYQTLQIVHPNFKNSNRNGDAPRCRLRWGNLNVNERYFNERCRGPKKKRKERITFIPCMIPWPTQQWAW